MAKKKLSQNEIVKSPKHPEWLDTIVADRHCDNNLYKIVLFFVIFSPCPKYCTQGRTLQYYNWKDKPWSTNRYLKNKLDNGVFSDKKKYFRCVEHIPQLVEAIHKAELEDDFYIHREVERVAFIKTEGSEYMSLFHHIRCALAHGRIALFEDTNADDVLFVMENGNEIGAEFQVKARMILRRSTLLKWIEIITAGPQEPERNYRREIYEALRDNNRLRKKDLVNMLCESEYVINNAISFLKNAKIITYQNHGKHGWWEVNVSNAETYFSTQSVERSH